MTNKIQFLYSENSEKTFAENMEKVQALKNMFGIKEHYVETIM